MRQTVRQSQTGMWRRASPSGGVSFLVSSTFEPSELHTIYGAPAALWTQYDFPPSPSSPSSSSRVNVSLALYNKTATRLPEGLFLRLRPAAAAAPPGPGGSLVWRVNKLGQAVNVLVQGEEGVIEGGNQRQHGAVGGVTVTQHYSSSNSSSNSNASSSSSSGVGSRDGQGLLILTPDAPLATFGDPSIFPVPTAAGSADPAFGLSLLLMDNLWSTNYPYWQPWKQGDENIQWRFSFEAL